MHKIAIILSGCGYLDGAEITEAVITLLELDKNGCKVKAFAPNTNQMHTVNHLTSEETNQTRTGSRNAGSSRHGPST